MNVLQANSPRGVLKRIYERQQKYLRHFALKGLPNILPT